MGSQSAYEAYVTGNMTKSPGDRAEYVARVKDGLVQLPEGKTLLPEDLEGGGASTQTQDLDGAQVPVEEEEGGLLSRDG